ncbi:MAG: DUF3417 domain-containing protein [Acidobacteriaceae bacterium]|nr:DUF3417 domain-containing protein [Acidobacteriaceae bacterium]
MGDSVSTNVPLEQKSDSGTELALDLRWTWNHSTDELWRDLEPELWQTTQNPWLILQAASRGKLRRLLSEQTFRTRVDALLASARSRPVGSHLDQSRTPGSIGSGGKAHPEDALGQVLIKQWNEFLRRPEVQRHAVF